MSVFVMRLFLCLLSYTGCLGFCPASMLCLNKTTKKLIFCFWKHEWFTFIVTISFPILMLVWEEGCFRNFEEFFWFTLRGNSQLAVWAFTVTLAVLRQGIHTCVKRLQFAVLLKSLSSLNYVLLLTCLWKVSLDTTHLVLLYFLMQWKW